MERDDSVSSVLSVVKITTKGTEDTENRVLHWCPFVERNDSVSSESSVIKIRSGHKWYAQAPSVV